MCLPRARTLLAILCAAQLFGLVLAYGYALDAERVLTAYDDATPVAYAFGVPDKLSEMSAALWSCVLSQVLVMLMALYVASCG